MVKNLPVMWETWIQSVVWEDPLGEGMATHSSSLAWRISKTEEPMGLQSIRLQRVGQNWANKHSMPGAIMGGPTRDEVMKKIPGRQGCLGPHPWRGYEEETWQARPSRIRDPPGWPRPLPHAVSSPLCCYCSCLPCCRFLCCLLRALLLLFHWIKTNLKP